MEEITDRDTLAEALADLSYRIRTNDRLSVYEIRMALNRLGHQVRRLCACSDHCCTVHQTHVTPHRGCLLR